MTATAQFQAIVLTDGHCNLCNRSVQYLVRHDPERRLRFAAQQSSPGPELLRRAGLDGNLQPGIVLLDPTGRNPIVGADALPVIARILRPRAKLLRFLSVLPGFLRNFGYAAIARNRYRIFGRNEVCQIVPGPGLDDRLLTISDVEALG